MMNKQQIIVLFVSILAVILIYQLPRVVVENETVTEMEQHDVSISDEDQQLFSSLAQGLKESQEIKKSVNFADSLARLLLKYRLTDSAVFYGDKILGLDSSDDSKYKAAVIYYQAFQISTEKQSATEQALKARRIFEDLLEDDPLNSSLKNKLAMTLITTETPMMGVQMLREVLVEEPNNREATLNLGLLAIQSGQYDRARERFEALIELDSFDFESLFYLGVALNESGDLEKGKEIFKKLIAKEGVDPALKATASSYLEEL